MIASLLASVALMAALWLTARTWKPEPSLREYTIRMGYGLGVHPAYLVDLPAVSHWSMWITEEGE